MTKESEAEFALRVSDQILGQIEADRAVNKQNIAFLIEREVRARQPAQAPDKHEVMTKARAFMDVIAGMSGVIWPNAVLVAYNALGNALFAERNNL